MTPDQLAEVRRLIAQKIEQLKSLPRFPSGEVGIWGAPLVIAPNVDRLADELARDVLPLLEAAQVQESDLAHQAAEALAKELAQIKKAAKVFRLEDAIAAGEARTGKGEIAARLRSFEIAAVWRNRCEKAERELTALRAAHVQLQHRFTKLEALNLDNVEGYLTLAQAIAPDEERADRKDWPTDTLAALAITARADLTALTAENARLKAERDAYRLAGCQMHNGLVGHMTAGAFNALLAEDGIRLYDQAEAVSSESDIFPDDRQDILSWKGKCEEAEAALARLQQGIREAPRYTGGGLSRNRSEDVWLKDSDVMALLEKP